MKYSNDTTGNRTRDLPVCSAVPQPTAPPAAYTRSEVKLLRIFLKTVNLYKNRTIYVPFLFAGKPGQDSEEIEDSVKNRNPYRPFLNLSDFH
jgi:hypothetical protein